MAKAPSADAVVVLSGGQDSAICLAIACRRFGADRVAAITYSYGQRHGIETKYAKALAKKFVVKAHKIVRLDFYRELTDNALMNGSLAIARKKGEKVPTTLVEGRNPLFLLLAGVWAKSLGAKTIYTGVSQADYSGYPDCREEFVKAQENAMRLAMEWPFEIETPFMHLDKAAEWKMAEELGIFDIVMNGTVTCYNGIPGKGCGKCPSCRLRSRGLKAYLAEKKKR